MIHEKKDYFTDFYGYVFIKSDPNLIATKILTLKITQLATPNPNSAQTLVLTFNPIYIDCLFNAFYTGGEKCPLYLLKQGFLTGSTCNP